MSVNTGSTTNRSGTLQVSSLVPRRIKIRAAQKATRVVLRGYSPAEVWWLTVGGFVVELLGGRIYDRIDTPVALLSYGKLGL